MADDTRDKDTATAIAPAAPSSSSTTTAPTPLPKGMILGKDGKPCRTCNSSSSFSAWTASAKKASKAPISTTTTTTNDCPPDVEQLGRSSWTLLHSITATYPITPTPTEQTQASQFMGLFSKLYPCWVCAEDFQEFMARNRIRTESRESFGRWMCEAHNEVNRKLGKREFDCGRWEERWGTGWKDGRCG